MPALASSRSENVEYVSEIIDAEIRWRNERKESQENAARGVIVSAGLVLSLLLGLSDNTGLFSQHSSTLTKASLAGIIALGGAAAAASILVLFPRKYDRLGKDGLDHFNKSEFLDKATHEVMGAVVATRIGIVTAMDDLHEKKAFWLKISFGLLIGAFLCLTVQGVALAIDPPSHIAGSTVSIPPTGINK